MALTKECNERHRTLRWWLGAILTAVLGISLAVAGFFFAANGKAMDKATEAKEAANNNEVTLARVEESTKNNGERLDRIDQKITAQTGILEDIKEATKK
jgi:hypothetical protein